MNTIPGKVRKFAHDSVASLKYMKRKRPHVIEKPETEFKSLQADFEALDSLCYFLLGTMFDAILDIIYENDLPQSNVNPLITFWITVVFYQIPTMLVFVEILGAVPGRSTLYSFAYAGTFEVFAFLCGWIWLGAAASRVAATIHFFISNILLAFKNVVDLQLAILMGGLLIYMFIPFASRKVSVSLNRAGAIIRVTIVVFLSTYIKKENLTRTAGRVTFTNMVMPTLNFFQLYYTLPMVSPMLQKATRTTMLIRKMIIIMVCIVLFHACFFTVLVGNTPFEQNNKPWVFKLVGKVRPMPYLLIFVVSSYVSQFCGVLATVHGASVLLHQMSSDGIIFSFISSSVKLRIVFFLTSSASVYFSGFEYSRDLFVALSSVGMLLAATCLLLLKSRGHPGFYDRVVKAAKSTDKKKKKKKFVFMEGIVSSMIILILIGSVMGGFVIRYLINEPFNPYSTKFFALMIMVCLILVAIFIMIVAPKFQSVHATVRCPFGPFIPTFVILLSSVDFALKIDQVVIGVTVWILSGLLFYLLFGLKNVTDSMTSETEEEQVNKPKIYKNGNQSEDYRIFEILKKRLEVCESKIAKRKQDLKSVGAQPLCAHRDVKLETPKRNLNHLFKLWDKD